MRRASQHSRGAARAQHPHRLRAPLECERPKKPDHADDVVAVEMRDEHIVQRERDAVPHHLPLRSLAAIEEQRLALADHRERGDVALDRWPCGAGTEEAYGEGHSPEYIGFDPARGCEFLTWEALWHLPCNLPHDS